MSTYEGGLGTREGGDLVRWTLNVEEFIENTRTFDSRVMQAIRTRPPEATLILHSVTKEECEAAVALVNEIRSASQGIVITPSKAPSIGDRFAGLEFD